MQYQGLILLKQTTGNEGQCHHRSHLFTVQWWGEQPADDQVGYRGRVWHVASGEERDLGIGPMGCFRPRRNHRGQAVGPSRSVECRDSDTPS